MNDSANTLQTAAVSGLELALNKALELDPQASAAISQLEGNVFHLDCTSPALSVYLLPLSKGVRLTSVWEEEVTTAIRGEASDFAELASSEDPAATLINGRLELRGNSSPLMELQSVIAQLDMDWESPLVDAFGDVAGHQLAEALRGMFGWSRQAARSIHRQVEEFIIEEARLTPPRQEVEDFYQDVRALEQQVERLELRVKKLTQQWEQAQ